MIEVRYDDPKEKTMTYTHHLTLDQPYAQAVESVRAALSEQGFGIITEIDMRATFEKKLDADAAEEIGDYIILGACNPSLARRALAAEPQLGALLPCNVIVQQVHNGLVEVAAIDPVASMQAVENPDLHEAARDIREKLAAAMTSLGG